MRIGSLCASGTPWASKAASLQPDAPAYRRRNWQLQCRLGKVGDAVTRFLAGSQEPGTRAPTGAPALGGAINAELDALRKAELDALREEDQQRCDRLGRSP